MTEFRVDDIESFAGIPCQSPDCDRERVFSLESILGGMI